MAGFGEENVILGVALLPVGHVLEQDEDARAVIVGVNQTARADQHGAPTDGRELGRHLVSNDGRRPGDDLAHKALELGDIPLAVAKVKKAPPDGVIASDPEGFVEPTIGCKHATQLVKNQEGFLQGVNDPLRLACSLRRSRYKSSRSI